jgi:mono/diheme cytochrome c family protein
MTKRIFISLLAAAAVAEAGTEEAERLFTLKVKGILAEKCNGCHGDDPGKVKGDYNMLTREGLLAGGEFIGDEVLVPGDAAKSFLVTAIKWDDPDFEMPPKENDRLTAEQIALLEQWINAGAPWPSDERQAAIVAEDKKRLITEDGVIVETSGGLGDEWTHRRYQPGDIWAFRSVRKPEVPASDSSNPIDICPIRSTSSSGRNSRVAGPLPRQGRMSGP